MSKIIPDPATYTNILAIVRTNSGQTLAALDMQINGLLTSLVDKMLERAAIQALHELNKRMHAKINNGEGE